MADAPQVNRSADPTRPRTTSRRLRRQQRRRARELRRAILATTFVALQITGFWLANFADHDSWTELSGFLLLQPVQIFFNLLDSHFQLTRGVRDADAVLLVTLISLPLNVLFWYAVWRLARKVRRHLRRQRHSPGSPYGPAPRPAQARHYQPRPAQPLPLPTPAAPPRPAPPEAQLVLSLETFLPPSPETPAPETHTSPSPLRK